MSASVLSAIAVSALCTLFLRALPFLFFGKSRTMPAWMTRLGAMLPPAIMAVLVVYCLKDAVAEPVRTGIPQLLGVLTVVISYKIRHSTFLSIVSGTAVVMLALRLLPL